MSPNLLSPRQVCARISLSRTTLDRLVAARKFPQPVRISEKRLAYSTDAVDAWIASKLEKVAA